MCVFSARFSFYFCASSTSFVSIFGKCSQTNVPIWIFQLFSLGLCIFNFSLISLSAFTATHLFISKITERFLSFCCFDRIQRRVNALSSFSLEFVAFRNVSLICMFIMFEQKSQAKADEIKQKKGKNECFSAYYQCLSGGGYNVKMNDMDDAYARRLPQYREETL